MSCTTTLAAQILAHYTAMEELYKDNGGKGNPLTPLMDAYAAAHPGLDIWDLKAAQYRILSEHMETVIFDESPFYFVNNMCFRDGVPGLTAADWLYQRNRHLYRDENPEVYDRFMQLAWKNIYSCCGPYVDEQHFCYPVSEVVRIGLRGAYENIQKQKEGANADEARFLACAEAGVLAARRVAERFAAAARARAAAATDPAVRRNMEMLASAAERAPWEPCASFFEGLNTLWFCRNVMGVMDGIGNSHLGRPDLLLFDLYQQDLANGVLDKEEAADLVRQFLLFGDKSYRRDKPICGGWDQEMELGIVLGGCDSEGRPVCNELTHLFLQAHREIGAIYPKLHCRIASDSSDEYLAEIAKDFAAGRSVIGLCYDSGYLPALLRDGLTPEDARGYVNTGCWSAISEGNESVPGGNYVYLLTLLEQSVYGPTPDYAALGIPCRPLDEATDFASLYAILLENILAPIRFRDDTIGRYGRIADRVNPLPLASAFLHDCLARRRDFTQGGCRYNRNTVQPYGFANIVDALLAMKRLCFDEKRLTLQAYLDAVRHNWEGHEELLHAVRNSPHFGDLSPESVAMSQRLHRDLYNGTRAEINERGGHYSLDYVGYREFLLMAKHRRATPDGRRDGDLFALGIGPSRYHPADALTEVVQSVGALDASLCNVSSLDLQLPLGQTDVPRLTLLLRAFGRTGIKHLQLNVVDLQELRDAQVHPEMHRDLVVRVCGFSARFVMLSPVFQEEIIRRYLYEQ